MTEIRCVKCRRLLFKGYFSKVEIKCPKCGYVQTLWQDEDTHEQIEVQY